MKTPRFLHKTILLALLALAPAATHAQGTAFTYQGRLDVGGVPVNGSNDLTFTLYNASSFGATVGTSNVFNDLPVSNGLFTVTLDFGAGTFDGSARWLQIAARPGASTGAYTNLAPRQSVTPTPYAMFAGGASAAGVSGTLGAAQIPTLDAATKLTGTVADARLSANVALRAGGNTFTGTQVFTNAGTSGFSVRNQNGSFNFLGNAGAGDGTRLMASLVGAGTNWPRLRFEREDGGTFMDVGQNANGNFFVKASGTERFTVMNNGNVGIGTAAPAARLEVSDGTTSLYVIPGQLNGNLNTNAVTLEIPGSKTLGVWDNLSVANHLGVGESLTVAGETTTTAVNITSDRNAKEDFSPVNAREILAKVAALPITEWQYKKHDDARHIGPMAQDFRAAFGTGRDDKHITSVDADGVALAAIQGLNEIVREKDAELARLREAHDSVLRRLAEIERAVGLKSVAVEAK